ncbi:ubiquinol-cytochrome c reductase cytochrome c1 subunit [Yoonia tamlensis]|uniref:Cytochrome c1 n=2 Tax=Yoonia tamlensis TaxID=390270 RepID=A0A1I6HGE4_9RHOB|nr:ubiquinol-cytochrome c reductase cytochrome c1 subunit [Yoonia tamlensis]
MFRKLTLTAATALALTTGQAIAESETHIEDFDFSFEGPFGSYDQMQLQRGLQIYTENCSSCHGLEYVAFRTLHDEGGPALPEDQMRAYAEFYEIYDPAIDDYRLATPADKFPAVTAAGAPDLSLMAKSRAGFHGPLGSGLNQLFKGMGGAEYIASILTGYEETPECAPEDFDGYYNVAFAAGGFPEECIDDHGHHMVPGSWIGMPQPLWGDDVEFADGHSTDIHHEAQDIAAFLMWTAEPKMMDRKHAGLAGVILLIMLSVLLYLTNKRLWAPHKHKD